MAEILRRLSSQFGFSNNNDLVLNDRVNGINATMSSTKFKQLADGMVVNSTTAATYLLALTDANTWLEASHAVGCEVTIPPNADVAFDVGTVVSVAQAGAGPVTFVGGSGVTLSVGATFDPETAEQHAVASIIKVATNTWRLTGHLAAA